MIIIWILLICLSLYYFDIINLFKEMNNNATNNVVKEIIETYKNDPIRLEQEMNKFYKNKLKYRFNKED